MRILFIDWPCFGKVDVQFTLEQAGHEFVTFFHDGYQDRINPDFDKAFKDFVGDNTFDFCFSFNFFPIVSNNCKDLDIKYVSVIYDSPYVMLYSYALINANNYVFMFDKQEYLKLKKGGINTIYYCTLLLMPQSLITLCRNHMTKTNYLPMFLLLVLYITKITISLSGLKIWMITQRDISTALWKPS